MSRAERFSEERPREYAAAALVVLGNAGELVAEVRPDLLEQLAGGGAVFGPPAQRDAVVELARAARAFADAVRVARERGVL